MRKLKSCFINLLKVHALIALLVSTTWLSDAQAWLKDSSPYRLAHHVNAGETFQGIRLLGTVSLRTVRRHGYPLAGLSGLAWDEDEQRLYAISDKGALFHLQPIFQDGLLHSVEVLAAYPLTDNKGRALSYPWADAEGLVVRKAANGKRGDSELLVSYEVRPRVRVYRPDGSRLGGELLPARLENIRNYYGRNSALESLALHPRYGLLTAPQQPLRSDKSIRIYTQKGRSWAYALSDEAGNSLVAMEALPDGDLLLLERAFAGLTQPVIVKLRRGKLSGQTVKARTLATLNSAEGWRLDNFEGLTQHRQQHFFMISDDNSRFWQNTLLVYFALLDSEPGS